MKVSAWILTITLAGAAAIAGLGWILGAADGAEDLTDASPGQGEEVSDLEPAGEELSEGGEDENQDGEEREPGEERGEREEEVVMHFFWSQGCPYCEREKEFIREVLRPEYPELEIRDHNIADRSTHDTLRELAGRTGAQQHLGVTPLTFVGEEYFVGFDGPAGVGQEIIEVVEQELANLAPH